MAKDRRTKSDALRLPTAPAKQIGIRVPARMSDQLEALARRENNSTSSIVRRLLTQALADADGDEAA